MTTARSTYSSRAHAYCQRVVSGEQIASKWIKLAAQKHLQFLRDTGSRWHYDSEHVERCCSFIESLTLSNGMPFRMSDWQVWITASLMGFVDEAGLRKHIEALLICSKGSGKSPWAAGLGLWFAFFDDPRLKQAEVYCGALSIAQAQEVFTPARLFVESQPGFAAVGITAQKRSIFSPTGARFQPVIGRGRHGARPYLAILDELHQAISPDLYDTFKTGCNKTVNSLLLTISTAGIAAQDNPCYTLQDRAQKSLDGTLPDERFFAALYVCDDSMEWTSEEALIASNPNLGISSDAEKIRLAIADAARNPGKQNNVKAMHLGIWSTAAESWMDMLKFNACADLKLTPQDCKHLPCVIGSDLARVLDLTALVLVFRDDSQGDKPHYYAFTKAYAPEDRVEDPSLQHYAKWVSEGHLTSTQGSELDYAVLQADAVDWINRYQVRELAYDERYATDWAQRIEAETAVTRVVAPPTPAVLSPAMREIDAAVAGGRFHFDGNPLLAWCMSNVQTYVNETNGNYRFPDKTKAENKIDAAVALFLGMSRALLLTPPAPMTWAFQPFTI